MNMQILVLSDSHGNIPAMIRAVEKVKPTLIFHLGDYWRDGERLQKRFPKIPMVQVPGNCDFSSREPAEKQLELSGKRLLLCHGHTYGVKQSLLRAGYAAEEQGLDVFLFGHTHCALAERRGKTLFLNPGSIGASVQASYAVLTLTDGLPVGQLFTLLSREAI